MADLHRISRWFIACGLGGSLAWSSGCAVMTPRSVAAEGEICPAVLDHLVKHRVVAGETLNSIAQRYGLVPETLMGLNPSLRDRQAPIGAEILIPPFNGVRVEVPPGTTLQQIALKYKVRADVLFEANGCQPAPRTVFVPGITWTPLLDGKSAPASAPFAIGYPLPQPTKILLGFGFQVRDGDTIAAHSGVDLAAKLGTPVLAVADGTVAFVGMQGSYGNLVVINHQDGYQTRYAQLDRIQVKLGQRVQRGTQIGTVGMTGKPSSPQPHLHFEVRSNSKLGWVAEDPRNYLKQ